MRRNLDDAEQYTVAGVVARSGRARCSTLWRGGLDVQCDYAAAYRLDGFFTAGADDRVQGTDVRNLV